LSDEWVAVHAILWRRDFFWKVGAWNENMTVNDDGELMLRALLGGPRIAKSTLDRAVYVQHSGARVSGQVSRHAGEAQLSVLEAAFRSLGSRLRHPIIHRSLSRTTFETARKFYELGYDDLGGRCEKLWRTIGPPFVRNGSISNRIVSTVIGLRRKVTITKLGRRLFKDLFL
jgi:hypothetical protein